MYFFYDGLDSLVYLKIIRDLKLGNNSYKILEIKAHYEELEFKATKKNKIYTYKFHSPWLALNEKNYKIFKNSSIKKRRSLLKRILIGNILSISKYLGYTVPKRLICDIELFLIRTIFKGIDMIGFKGKFEINFLIPDYLGIGKAVSHGFGIVKKVSNT